MHHPTSAPLHPADVRPWRLDLGVASHWSELVRLLPGVALCAAVTTVAFGLQEIENRWFGRAWLETLVLSILVGAAVRTFWRPGLAWRWGVDVCAKLVLEVAIVLLGASVSAKVLFAAGPALLIGIAGLVILSLGVSYGIGRLLGLPWRMAALVACGNSICGNSAIVAVAPVIGAESEDVATSIAFTAMLGVVVVLALPALGGALGLTGLRYGALAGLTVYAVPQVLAAAAPMGPIAVQFGAIVKMVRVLMLGPVCVMLSLLIRAMRSRRGSGGTANVLIGSTTPKLAIHTLVPWFILGFLAVAFARSAGLISPAAGTFMSASANLLTMISMAALGLGTDIKAVARAGVKVSAVAGLSLTALILTSLGLLRVVGLS